MSDTPYTEQEQCALAALLDTLIPASEDGRLPGAGSLGLAKPLAAKLPDLQPALAGGPGLEELSQEHPELLPGLVFQTYVHYYQHPQVQEALGLEGRPPHPLGYTLEDGDLGRLQAVRQRGRLYREV